MRASAMTAHLLSRRDLLKSGALIVGFNLFEPVARVFAQGLQAERRCSTPGGLPPTPARLVALAVAPRGTVSVFTSKVDLGTGTGSQLDKFVPRRLDCSRAQDPDEIGDTTRSVDQGRTAAAARSRRAGPQLRQLQQPRRQER